MSWSRLMTMVMAALLASVALMAAPDAHSAIRPMLTIAPAAYDFGDAVLQTPQENVMFVVTIQKGIADSVRVSITGPDAGDFKADASTAYFVQPIGGAKGPTCQSNRPSTPQQYVTPPPKRPPEECELGVAFVPRTVGPKSAALVITEPGGATLTAALKGNGVKGCTYAVVSCNYAFMYSGNIRWTEAVKGPAGSSTSQVDVTVTNGVGVCNGSATSVFTSNFGTRSKTGAITGQALVAVEFDFYEELEVSRSNLPPNVPNRQNESNPSMWIPLGYKVTVACPSPDWPASASGDEPATPPTPAEMDGRERSSYPQRATALMQKHIQGSGSASPEDDALNGVTGQVSVSWDLKRP